MSLGPFAFEDDGAVRSNLPGQLSVSGDALLTTSYADDGITSGKGYIFEKNFTIASGATLNIVYDYTTYTPSGTQFGQVYVMPPTFSTTAGPVTVSVYRGTDYAGGTEFDAINPNTTVANTTSETTFTYGATGTVKGTLVLDYLVGGASQGNQSASGATSGLAFFIRGTTQKTLFEIVNSSGSSITFHFGQVIYEI